MPERGRPPGRSCAVAESRTVPPRGEYRPTSVGYGWIGVGRTSTRKTHLVAPGTRSEPVRFLRPGWGENAMDARKASDTAALTAMLRAAHQLLDDEPRILDDPVAVRLVEDAPVRVAAQ